MNIRNNALRTKLQDYTTFPAWSLLRNSLQVHGGSTSKRYPFSCRLFTHIILCTLIWCPRRLQDARYVLARATASDEIVHTPHIHHADTSRLDCSQLEPTYISLAMVSIPHLRFRKQCPLSILALLDRRTCQPKSHGHGFTAVPTPNVA